MGHLDHLDQREIRVTAVYLVRLDLLDQKVLKVIQALLDPRGLWVHLVLKEIVEKKDLKVLMEPRVSLVLKGYLERMACQETRESQDQEAHQDQLVPKETLDLKVYLVFLVLRDLLVPKEKEVNQVKWGPKALKESQEWMVQQDQLGPLVFKDQKEIMVLLVHQALQLKEVQVYLVP